MPLTTTNEDTGSAGGSGSRSYDQPNEAVVSFLIAELQDSENESVEFPTFSDNDDAVGFDEEVREQVEEAYGVSIPDDIDNASIESLFEADWSEYDYIGYAPDDAEVGKVNANAHTDKNTAVNGYFAEKITDAFGDDARVRMGISPKQWRDSVEERGEYTRVMVSNTDHQKEQRIKERAEVGAIDSDEKESLLAEIESEE